LRLLVVNAGSSSLKLSVLDDADTELLSRTVPAPRGRVETNVLRGTLAEAGDLDAVGHRIVHGGDEFVDATVVDERVRRRLGALTDLAPLHQPKSLHALDEVTRELPDVPAVACFDTAFHATIPAAAATYALPQEWRRRWNLRRYGFHGLSHAYIARRAAELVPGARRVVSCHLGAGASLCAIDGGRSVDTTMGFTPLEGLVMATRSGSVDPGLIVWLEEHVGMPPSELAATLEHRSGLLGLTGESDLRVILEAESAGSEDAALGVAVYLHRLCGQIAAMTAALGGLDVLVYTGGVGENAAEIRRRSAEGLSFLGVRLDEERNAASVPDAEIGAPDASVRTFVVRAREDLQIARDVRRALGF
jgi:acetate kinase